MASTASGVSKVDHFKLSDGLELQVASSISRVLWL